MPFLRFYNDLVLVGRKIKITMDCGTTQHQHILRWWEWEDPLKKHRKFKVTSANQSIVMTFSKHQQPTLATFVKLSK